jgi:pyruvate dehydrogenase E2 component (dihydrolipoamide acetyltransferase)
VEQQEKLDYAERWMRDGLSVVGRPGGFLTIEVDMSEARERRNRLKDAGTAVTYTQILVAAVGSALTKHAELHRLIAGNRRLLPDTVDICVSISGDHAVTPVLIVKDAGRKSLQTIAAELRDGAAKARAEDEQRLGAIRKWGWIVPFAFLRRLLIRSLLNQLWYRRRASGTFQVTVVSTADLFVPFLFNTAAALGVGRVQDRVVPRNGQVEIRPILELACCFDHKVWNGMDTANFLNAVKAELERAGD